ncbi:MAG: glycine cleavage system protein T, partial [Thermoleophilia bacterium]|nr:glycine cleavage system protein T [Thermoleophilia bacterium]
RGIARAGSPVFFADKPVGWVTSGTMVPYWKTTGTGLLQKFTDGHDLRPLCLALIDSTIKAGDIVTLEVREKQVEALVVPHNLRSDAPPYARPILWSDPRRGRSEEQTTPLAPSAASAVSAPPAIIPALNLLRETAFNHRWRQEECINLIPSEMTQSPAVRLLSTADPAGRYAEHRPLEALGGVEVYYYQGT